MEEKIMKKRMVSGIKPTGKLTLGNYIGAIKQFITYQDEYENKKSDGSVFKQASAFGQAFI